MPAAPSPERIASIDAFRGFTMFCMFSAGFGLNYFAGNPWVAPVARQFEHTEWHGMTAWDLVQPFFMFIVGAVMPVSFGRRWKAGESWAVSLRHVLKRALLLFLCGEIARSIQARRPVLDLTNVLAQLAFTYPVAFLVLRRSWRFQAVIAGALLFGYWALFRFASAPGVTGPWDPDANIGWYLDGVVLGEHWGDHFGYVTIDCVAATANTIFGVMAGTLLVNPAFDAQRKIRLLVACGIAGIVAGLALDPIVPIIKKIWTPSFAIYSTGYTLVVLAWFYWLVDVRKRAGWVKMFVIVGANSIFIYLFHEILGGYIWAVARRAFELVFDLTWSKALAVWVMIAVHIAVCWELWRRKIFFRL